jgi:biopolymer transport protein ExbD
MAQQRQFLDVWIVESNTVYKQVPYTVVLDWVQQGRLLEEDRIKPSGTADWQKLGEVGDVAAFLPQPDPMTAEDEAEALEPVALDFQYKKPHGDEDDDVDMIPLIDVSLVLLIFFMLTASTVGSGLFVDTPPTDYGLVADDADAWRIDIDKQGEKVSYSLGRGDKSAEKEDSGLTSEQEVLDRLKGRLARETGRQDLVINAHKALAARYARHLLVALREEPFRDKLRVNYFGVSDKEP